MFHHYGQKLYYNFWRRSQKNLPLSSSFSITYGVESVAQNINSHHVEPWYIKHTDVNTSFKTIAMKISVPGTTLQRTRQKLRTVIALLRKRIKRLKAHFLKPMQTDFSQTFTHTWWKSRSRERERNSFLDHNIFPVASLSSHFQFPGAVLGSKARVNRNQQTQWDVFPSFISVNI